MPIYQYGLVMQCGGKGWKEIYYRVSSGSIETTRTIAETLASKRAFCNGADVLIEACTVTDPISAGRQGVVWYFNPNKNGVDGQTSGGAVGPSVSINIGYRNNAQNLTRRIQMRGVWDTAVTFFNQLNTPAYANWFSQFAQLRSYLLNQNFGWITRPRAAVSQCSYVIPTDTELPQFTFQSDFFPEEEVNTFQSVRFSRFNGSNSVLNRELVVFVTSRFQATSSLPLAAGPMTAPGRCLRYGAPEFVGADDIGVERVGRRATGRPLLRTPGRSRARART